MSKICFMNECKEESQTYFSPRALTKPRPKFRRHQQLKYLYQVIKGKRQVLIPPLSPQRIFYTITSAVLALDS